MGSPRLKKVRLMIKEKRVVRRKKAKSAGDVRTGRRQELLIRETRGELREEDISGPFHVSGLRVRIPPPAPPNSRKLPKLVTSSFFFGHGSRRVVAPVTVDFNSEIHGVSELTRSRRAAWRGSRRSGRTHHACRARVDGPASGRCVVSKKRKVQEGGKEGKRYLPARRRDACACLSCGCALHDNCFREVHDDWSVTPSRLCRGQRSYWD